MGKYAMSLARKKTKFQGLEIVKDCVILAFAPIFNGVPDGTRTRDKQNHNLSLYQLNYGHHVLDFIGLGGIGVNWRY